MIRLPLLDHWPPDHFPAPAQALDEPPGLLAFGGDLSPLRLRAAYALGIFPWFNDGEPILWWSPNPRCVFRTDALRRPHRSLRRLLARCDWTITVDRAFRPVMQACAEPRDGQPGTWISRDMIEAYDTLHRLGHAHSVEVWQHGRLVGGIYGVMSGRLFSGESMFSRESGGSKVALLALARQLHGFGVPLIDAQVSNPHLLGLGAVEMPRTQFLAELAALSTQPVDAAAWAPTQVWQACDLLS
ncbi:leucyl/phenylalanyl-tRNA--protein transferase [Dyella sp.]|jgi:leucyl/phenylalanyl-tRNA--protein transferase|uniref:leucyl/phenylalanyl-tRNA--protein transferase n=1 Tax=Dyella sp. TaxID=1869338 RepID=UPI002D793457|nr:leucyl/phenylalanyl-tRNA--protein transferase [Dyella sp.]HET6431045.1 leucyl/phenylalanyl-tRNA--protein transferase [Dyella sp.]